MSEELEFVEVINSINFNKGNNTLEQHFLNTIEAQEKKTAALTALYESLKDTYSSSQRVDELEFIIECQRLLNVYRQAFNYYLSLQ